MAPKIFDDERLNNFIFYKAYMTDVELDQVREFLFYLLMFGVAAWLLISVCSAVYNSMPKLKAFIKSFYKNVLVMRKYRAFWVLLTDSKFRADLNKLHTLSKDKKRVVTRRININRIVPGHKIIYPAYVRTLRDAIYIPPIKVVYDKSVRKYRIVDGNHRFEAIRLGRHSIITVEVMI